MVDIFDLEPESTTRDKMISKFNEWWTEDEIRTEIIPNILDENFIGAFNDQLQNYDQKTNINKKQFAEILYDFVGKNFLVNSDKHIRINFLGLILERQMKIDSSFKKRFLECLIQKKKSPSSDSCKECHKEWNESEFIFRQTLGCNVPIKCVNKNCIFKQQKKLLKNYTIFIQSFKLTKDYKIFCIKLLEELDLPIEIVTNNKHETVLLPDTVRPIGGLPPLHDYQSSIRLQILDMLENYNPSTSRALVALPTGSGKTRLVVETLIDWINDGKKGKENTKFILWIVDKKELCQQAFDTFANMFQHKGKKDSILRLHPIYDNKAKNIGDILYQHSDSSIYDEQNGIIIASIQSLYSISKNLDKGSLSKLGKFTAMVIIDEAHHAIPSNKSYNNVLSALGFEFRRKNVSEHKICLLGLTATPFRGDDKTATTTSLLNRFGKRILWPSISNSTNENYIPPHASLNVQRDGHQNEQIRLYAEGSYSITNERIIDYHFIILKHNPDDTTTEVYNKIVENSNIDFSFNEPGQYEIRLTVRDNKNKSKNVAISYIKILPALILDKKSNAVEMKNLYERLIRQEILATPHHYVINYSHRINITGEDKKRFETFHDISETTIKRIGLDPNRNNLIIQKLLSLINNENKKSILFFACSIEHSKYISMVLNALYGIKSTSVDYTISREERDKIMRDFRRGEISVLCNFNILTTGFDSPKVDCVFVARPTFSHVLYNQMIGRGLRGPKNNGTTNCIIVDISDNIQLELDEKIDESWQFFEYIYKTIYDESKTGPQTCFGCFGEESKNCSICSGDGIVDPRKHSKKKKSKESSIKINTKQKKNLEKEHNVSKIMELIYNTINFNFDELFDIDLIIEKTNIEEKHKGMIKPILDSFEKVNKIVKIDEKWTHNSNITNKKIRYTMQLVEDKILEVLKNTMNEHLIIEKIELILRNKNLLENSSDRIELIKNTLNKNIQEKKILRNNYMLYLSKRT